MYTCISHYYSEAVPFNASFASSLSELSINPSSGLLLPQNSDGTLFTVTYKPKTFDKRTNAILKIEVRLRSKAVGIIIHEQSTCTVHCIASIIRGQ